MKKRVQRTFGEGDSRTRECRECEKVFPLTADHFYRSVTPYCAGFEYRCKSCANVCRRRQDLVRLYGITEDDFEALALSQGGTCAVCNGAPRDGIGRSVKRGRPVLDVDHDHETGKVRGLLCRRCNVILGYVYEDPALLRALAEYLDKHRRP